MRAAAAFNEAALEELRAQIERLRRELSFEAARALPAAEARDVVVADKEVQLTIYRQSDVPALQGDVLITVQISRFGLGGTVSFKKERGLVFSADSDPRDATDTELRESGG